MFALGVFENGSSAFVGMAFGDEIVRLQDLQAAWIAGGRLEILPSLNNLTALIDDWDRAFPILEQMADLARAERDRFVRLDLASLRPRPPIIRPGKILHSAANFRDHVAEMSTYNAAAGARDAADRFTGVKEGAKPYLFLKAATALTGAYDDIEIPAEAGVQIDWEAELAVVIGRKGRSVRAADARQHIAGYITANDVTRRDTLWRDDRPNFKTDWLASKSTDGFLPMGPVFVPAAFVADPHDLRITLSVNGVQKQSGSTAEMIFSAEEQIEFATRFMTIEPGDIFVTGTVGGVGQSSGTFLKSGDIMETEIGGIGRMRNRII